jgi:hypothetical protein
MHAIIYSHDAEADRAFFREVLGFPSVDAGGGWLSLAMESGRDGTAWTNLRWSLADGYRDRICRDDVARFQAARQSEEG